MGGGGGGIGRGGIGGWKTVQVENCTGGKPEHRLSYLACMCDCLVC